VLLAAPKINLAACIVERSASGIVVDPDDPEECVAGAKGLAADAGLRSLLGANARRYAEREFNISAIASRFEDVLAKASPSTLFAAPTAPAAVVSPRIQATTET
jgi:glycosyltransferase involved in cell wall biosynthesis